MRASLTAVFSLCLSIAYAPAIRAQGEVPPNLTIAFIADQGFGADARAVLSRIAAQGADAVVHQGDYDYGNDPQDFEDQINQILGSDFPYFASEGNHDSASFRGAGGYQEVLEARMNRLGIPWEGDLGVQSSLYYEGIFIVLVAPSVEGPGDGFHDLYIRDQLAADNSIWRIVSWHKNMSAMQVGGKGNATGWGVYEESRRGGAIIMTGHEHSYSRTHLLSSVSSQTVASFESTLVLSADDTNTSIDEGRSFVSVTGLGGQSIRDQERCFPTTPPYGCNGEWASIYTSHQGANHGALFGVFNYGGDPRLAYFYFMDIDGVVVDEFYVESTVGEIPVNVPPVSLDDGPHFVTEGGTLSVSPPGVLENDNDPNGDALTAILVQDVASGMLTLDVDGSFTYTHDGSSTTSDGFIYKANDGSEDGNDATVTFTIGPEPPPGPANNPSPLNGAAGASVDDDLSWTAGAGAVSHDVYFGTNPSPGAGELQGNQIATSFDPGTLDQDTVYYWRIDEVNADGLTTTGSVWSFTTLAPDVVTILEARYDTGKDKLRIRATSSEQPPPPTLTVMGYGEMIFKKGKYELKREPVAPLPVPSTVTVVSSFGGSATAPVAGAPQPSLPGAASNPSPPNGANGVSVDVDLSWTPGSAAASHDVYFGTSSNPAAQGNQIGVTFDPGTLQTDTTYYWRVDEVNGEGTTPGNVWSFTTEAQPGPPGQATNPAPAADAPGVPVDVILSWAGSAAASHNVYFGTSSNPAAQGNQIGTTFNPGTLQTDTTYYWRVDEVNGLGTTPGPVWSFTTAPATPADVVTVLEARYNPGKDELRIKATSSEQPLPTLTVVGYGEMIFKKGKYELKLKPMAPLPVPSTVTVISSFGGSATALVVIK